MLGRVGLSSYHQHQHSCDHMAAPNDHLLSYHPRLHDAPSSTGERSQEHGLPVRLKAEKNRHTGMTATSAQHLQRQQSFSQTACGSMQLPDYPSSSQPLLPLILSYDLPNSRRAEPAIQRRYSPTTARHHPGAICAAPRSQYNNSISKSQYQHGSSPYSRAAAAAG